MASKFHDTSNDANEHADKLMLSKEKFLELGQVLQQLMTPEQQGEYLPNEFKKKRKKRQSPKKVI